MSPMMAPTIKHSTTFTDDATGVSVEVASTDAATIAELRKQGVKLVVSKDGNGYDSAQQQLAAAYTSPLDFSLYDISASVGGWVCNCS